MEFTQLMVELDQQSSEMLELMDEYQHEWQHHDNELAQCDYYRAKSWYTRIDKLMNALWGIRNGVKSWHSQVES